MSPTKVIAIPVSGRHAVHASLLPGRQPIIVDAGTPGSGRLIHDQVAALGVDPKEVRLIVVTHGHLDHFGSAAELSRLTGAPIAGHIADLGIHQAGRVSEPYLPIGLLGRLFARTSVVRETAEPFEPDVLIRGETHVSDFGVEARIMPRVMPTPGHTAGSVSLLTDDGDLVAGDLVATPLTGFVKGRPANPPFHDDRLGNLTSDEPARDAALGPTKPHPWALSHHHEGRRASSAVEALPRSATYSTLGRWVNEGILRRVARGVCTLDDGWIMSESRHDAASGALTAAISP